MAKLLVAVECDFEGYSPFVTHRCQYSHQQTLRRAKLAADVIQCECNGKAAFLAHTSPFMRREHGDAFFTSSDYKTLWNDVAACGGEIGLHVHEDEPDGSCLYYGYGKHIERVISSHVGMLEDCGVKPACHSTGYFGMNEWFVPALEANDLLVNLDNCGAFTKFTTRDWTVAPGKPYYMDPDDVTCEGASRVLSVPLGMTKYCRGEDGLMLAPNSLRYLRSLWEEIARESGDESVWFLWVEAQRMDRDHRKLRSFLRWLKGKGVEFVVPSEIYKDYAARVATGSRGAY